MSLEATLQQLREAPPVRVPLPLCSCGHGKGEHRVDLQRQRCDTGGCTCPGYDHAVTVHHVLRWEVPA